MKVAIVGTYPAGTFEKFKNYFSEKPVLILLTLKKQENMEFMSAILRGQMRMLWRSLRWH